MKFLFTPLIYCFFTFLLSAQTVHFKNKYGDPVVYVDGDNLRLKNQYGDALFYLDGQTIKRKNQYGEASILYRRTNHPFEKSIWRGYLFLGWANTSF